MSGMMLKLLAMITMLVDHIGYVFYPQYLEFRYVGRLAFPIFCFLLVEGFFHTKNIRAYLLRMGIFAVISEIPFDLALYNQVVRIDRNNVFLTLFLGLLVMYVTQMCYQKTGSKSYGMLACVAGMAAAEFLHTDYGAVGILLIYIFYLSWEGRNLGQQRGQKLQSTIMMLVFAGFLLVIQGAMEAYALFSFIPILAYTGKETGIIWERWNLRRYKKTIQYVCYAFYPAHLLVLYFIDCMING